MTVLLSSPQWENQRLETKRQWYGTIEGKKIRDKKYLFFRAHKMLTSSDQWCMWETPMFFEHKQKANWAHWERQLSFQKQGKPTFKCSLSEVLRQIQHFAWRTTSYSKTRYLHLVWLEAENALVLVYNWKINGCKKLRVLHSNASDTHSFPYLFLCRFFNNYQQQGLISCMSYSFSEQLPDLTTLT